MPLVVIGVSGSVASLRAATIAGSSYGPRHRYLVVTVVPTSGDGPCELAHRHAVDGARAAVHPAHTLVTPGDPAAVLCTMAADTGAAVLVIGSREGDGRHHRPVAAAVLAAATVPVLVVATPKSNYQGEGPAVTGGP